MSNFLDQILTFFAGMLIQPSLPVEDSNWQINKAWYENGDVLEFSALSKIIPVACKQSIENTVHAPTLMQGFHEFYLDGNLIATSGDRTLQAGSNLYNSLDVPCKKIAKGEVLEWRAINMTKSYAKLNGWPSIEESTLLTTLVDNGLQAVAAGGLIFVGIMCFSMFSRRLDPIVPQALLGASIFIGTFFILSVPAVFQFHIPTYYLHRAHDACLWVGTIFIWIVLQKLCEFPKILLKIHFSVIFLALFIIAKASNLDQSQVASTLAFISNLICLFVCSGIQIYSFIRKRFSILQLLQLLSVLSFCIAGINDILINAGVINSIPLFTIGASFSFIFVALATNEKLSEIHRERDHLKANLEIEVEEKTKSLREKSTTLERALIDLKQAQGELIQSSKLASLGTLSAGLAHEINNSLNYPTGALPALRRIMAKETITNDEKKRANEMLKLVGEGLELTASIIKNLKRYSGTQTEKENVELKKLVDGVLLLLKNQIKEIASVSVHVDESVCIVGSRVALSQVVMNLITNAIDAMRDKKDTKNEIFVEAHESNDEVTLSIRDTGCGIPESIREKILDPFFTTKEPGKGTGLGLFIVNKEISSMGGRLIIDSTPGQGTTVNLIFSKIREERAA